MGTAGYMSPEQVRGKDLDARSDLFSFGAVLYEMATGRMPFDGGNTVELCAAILRDEPRPACELNPGVSPELAAVIHKALEKDRNLRYQTAAEMRADLQRVKRDSESGKYPTLFPKKGQDGASGTSVVDTKTPTQAAQSGPLEWRTRLWFFLAAAVLVGALVGGGFYYRSKQNKPKLTEKDTIVIADFDNKTGDTVFDDTLKTALNVSLRQSPFLSILPENDLAQTLKLMTRPADTKLTPDVARELCQRAGSKAYIAGSIAGLGTEYVIGLKAVNCQTGTTLAQEQATANSNEKVLDAVGGAAAKLRAQLGESLASVQQHDVPLQQATTSSLEALKAYSAGRDAELTQGLLAALPFYKRANELDPNFALAYIYTSDVYNEFDDIERSREYVAKAFALRDRVSERERFRIMADYYDIFTMEIEKGQETCELWWHAYPRDAGAPHRLGAEDIWLGNYEQAIEHTKKALAINPRDVTGWHHLASSYEILGRERDAAEAIKKANEQFPDPKRPWQGPAWREQLKTWTAANQAASAGRLAEFRQEAGRAIRRAVENGQLAPASLREIVKAAWEAEMGFDRVARDDAQSSLARAPTRDVRSIAAIALARAGDTKTALKLAEELEREYPERSVIRLYWVATARAAVALQQGNAKQALSLLEVAEPVELGMHTTVHDGTIYPAYVRGEAYLALHQGDAAAREFQKFIDYKAILGDYPIGAFARLQLARAYAMQGDKVKAKAAYEDFLTLWKDGDPEIPIYKQAKAEYAKISGR